MPEPDLQGLEPLCYEERGPKKSTPQGQAGKQGTRGGYRPERRRAEEPRYSARNRGPMRGPRAKVNLGGS